MEAQVMEMNVFWMIVGMGLVTFIPRLLPLVAMNTENWPAWSRRMLSRVPFAILGALIFPGVLYAGEEMIWGIAGAVFAAVLAWFKAPLIAVVAGAILFLTGVDLLLP